MGQLPMIDRVMSYTLAGLGEKSSRKLLVLACINMGWESYVVPVLGLCKFLPVRLFLM